MLTGRTQAKKLVTPEPTKVCLTSSASSGRPLRNQSNSPSRFAFGRSQSFSYPAVNTSTFRTRIVRPPFREKEWDVDSSRNRCGRSIVSSYAGQVENICRKGSAARDRRNPDRPFRTTCRPIRRPHTFHCDQSPKHPFCPTGTGLRMNHGVEPLVKFSKTEDGRRQEDSSAPNQAKPGVPSRRVHDRIVEEISKIPA